MGKILNELIEYAEMEGTEIGEACQYLCSLYKYEPYLGKSFYTALIKEIKAQLKNFKQNYEIKQVEETVIHKYTTLELKRFRAKGI